MKTSSVSRKESSTIRSFLRFRGTGDVFNCAVNKERSVTGETAHCSSIKMAEPMKPMWILLFCLFFCFFLSKSATREGKPPINRFGTLKIKREKTQKIRKDDDASEMRTTQNDRARSARKTIRQRPKAKKKKRTNERKKEGKKESRRNETTAAAAAAACGNATEAGRSNGGRCCRAGSAALPLVGASTLANGHQGYLLFPAHRFCDLNPATSPLYGKVFTEFFFFSFFFFRSIVLQKSPLASLRLPFFFVLFCFLFFFWTWRVLLGRFFFSPFRAEAGPLRRVRYRVLPSFNTATSLLAVG